MEIWAEVAKILVHLVARLHVNLEVKHQLLEAGVVKKKKKKRVRLCRCLAGRSRWAVEVRCLPAGPRRSPSACPP